MTTWRPSDPILTEAVAEVRRALTRLKDVGLAIARDGDESAIAEAASIWTAFAPRLSRLIEGRAFDEARSLCSETERRFQQIAFKLSNWR